MQETEDGSSRFVFTPYEPSEYVHLRGDDGHTVGLTPKMAEKWLADQGITYRGGSGIGDGIRQHLLEGDASREREVYGIDEAHRFLDAAKDLSAQQHAADQHRVMVAVNKTADWITDRYPPEKYSYVGVGRSPAPVVAALRSHGHDVRSIPLSDFRPSPDDPNSILHRPFAEQHTEPPNPEQQRMLAEHFDEFLGDLPTDRNVMLVDYTQSGLSLLATQHYLQQHLNSREETGRAVHALAIHQDIDSGNLDRTARSAAFPNTTWDRLNESWWNTDRGAERAQWRERFDTLSLGHDGPLQEHGPPLGHALKSEAFDGLSEKGSYKILNQDPSTFDTERPRRHTEPHPYGAPHAHEVLSDAVRDAQEPHPRDPASIRDEDGTQRASDDRDDQQSDGESAAPAYRNDSRPPHEVFQTDRRAATEHGGSTDHSSTPDSLDAHPRPDQTQHNDGANPDAAAEHPGEHFSSPEQWGDRRDTAPVAHMRTERFDPSVNSRINGGDSPENRLHLAGNTTRIDYDVRRFQDHDGNWVREFTVKLDLATQDHTLPRETLDEVGDRARSALDENLNGRYRLPGGDQFHITVEPRVVTWDSNKPHTWFDDPAQNPFIKVHDSTDSPNGPTQLSWGTTHPGGPLAHEVMHFLGLGEGYADPKMLLRHSDEPGVMGRGAWDEHPFLTESNLHTLERISDSGPVIRDHPLGNTNSSHTGGTHRTEQNEQGPTSTGHGEAAAPPHSATGKDSHEVSFDQGSKEISSQQRHELDSFVNDLVDRARAARRSGTPLPRIAITGHGNGSRVPGSGADRARETGKQRAAAVRDAIQHQLEEVLNNRSLSHSDLRANDFEISAESNAARNGSAHQTRDSARSARVTLRQQETSVVLGHPGHDAVDVPKNLHLVWFGSSKPLTAGLGGHVGDWARKASESGWKMHVWVDDRAHGVNADFLNGLPGVETHNVREILPSNGGDAPDVGAKFHFALDKDAFNLASDIARYAILHEHGGAYLDADIAPGDFSLPHEPVRMSESGIPFLAPGIRDQNHADREMSNLRNADPEHWADRNPSTSDVVDWRYRSGDLNNNLIVSPPRSPFLREVMADLPGIATLHEQSNNLRRNAAHLTGPNRIERVIEKFLGAQGLRGPSVNHFRAGRAAVDPDMAQRWSHRLHWVTDESSDQLHDEPRNRPANEHGESHAPEPPARADESTATARTEHDASSTRTPDQHGHQRSGSGPAHLRGEADSQPVPRIVVTGSAAKSTMSWDSLPEYVRNDKSLGMVSASEVDTGRLGDVLHALTPPGSQGTHPEGIERIETAARNDLGSFLGGRSFAVRSGKQWYEATVHAHFPEGAERMTENDGPTQVELTAESSTTSSHTATVATDGSLGANVNGGPLVGPYVRVGFRTPLASPAVSRTSDVTTKEQRTFRSGEGSSNAEVPVRFDVRMTDAAGKPIAPHPIATSGRALLQTPQDFGTLTATDLPPEQRKATPEGDWGKHLDHPGTEAVVDVGDRFDELAARMHPSITRMGAPGREELRRFLSPTNLRNNLSQMLHGWVTSPDLVSPHASRGSAVQARATLGDAELLGVSGSTFTRVHESVSTGSGLKPATKSGLEVNGGFGGTAISAAPTGGAAGATGARSAHSTATNTAGEQSTSKVGMQVKGDTGLYKVRVDLSVRTRNGNPVTVPATAYMRVGLPEAAERGLPVPPGTHESVASPTEEKRFAPPYLASRVAMGDVKVSEHGPTNRVLPQVEQALGTLENFRDFLPRWAPSQGSASRTGRHLTDEQEKFANQRALTAALSPASLRGKWDSLLGPGVAVHLKKRGLVHNEYTEIRVRARLGEGEHLGEADQRNVRASVESSPKTGTSTTLTKGWSAGVEGRLLHTSLVDQDKAIINPATSLRYNHNTEHTQSASTPVTHRSLLVGSPKSQLFRHDTDLEVQITSYRRPRGWVKRLTPGSPLRSIPEPKVLARTMRQGETAPDGVLPLPAIRDKTTLWVSDGATSTEDMSRFRPGDPTSHPLGEQNPHSIQELLNRGSAPGSERPPRATGLHVEAVAGTEFLRDTALRHLDEAAGGDRVLGLPGSESRRELDAFFSPERVAANMARLSDHGMYVDGLHHDRRILDRVGGVGMGWELSNPKLVSVSDDISTENSSSGGHTLSSSRTRRHGWDFDIALNNTARPAHIPGFVGTGVLSVKPWSRSTSRSTSSDITGTVERNVTTPANRRSFLVRMDADVTLLAESHQRNLLHSTEPGRSGSVVKLPGGVFQRVGEDEARRMGLLPQRRTPEPAAPLGKLTSPRLAGSDRPSTLGLSVLEDPPDLRGLLANMREKLGARGAELLPDSVLNDAMRNQHALANLTSPAHVQAMQDSAMDGGITVLSHRPRTFDRTTYWSTLRMTLGEPEFLDVVNDGVEIDQTVNGGTRHAESTDRTTGWNAGLRAPMGGSPTKDPNISSTTGTGGGVEMTSGQQRSTDTIRAHDSQVGYLSIAAGPAARYRIPARFELVTGRGSEPGTTVTTEFRTLRARVPADSMSTMDHESAPRTNHVVQVHSREAEQGTPDAIAAWRGGSPTHLPRTAGMEAMRGASDVQEGALRALREAGVGHRITDPGTTGAHAVHSALSAEVLRTRLSDPDSPMQIPHLRAISFLSDDHAKVEIHRRLSNPRLVALSDRVTMGNPRLETSTRSTESKHLNTGSLTAAPLAGRTILPTPEPNGSLISTGGAEFAHSTRVGDGSSGGTSTGQTNSLRHHGRTGLVEYDVDYRVVAAGRHNTGVVDLHIPGSAHLRVADSDLNSVLHRDVPGTLHQAQDRLHTADETWLKAEEDADQVLRSTDDKINASTSWIDRANQLHSRGESAPEHTDELSMRSDAALARLWSATAARSEAEDVVQRSEQHGGDMAARVRQSAVDAAEDERRAADDHARLDAELRAREAPNEVDSAERELEDARNHARSLQAEWWSAKTTVDEEIRAFNENRKMEPASAPGRLAVPAGDRLPLIAEEPESLPHDHHAVPTPQANSLTDFLAPPRTAEAEGR